MSLRLRITLIATLLPGLALLGFGFVVYLITASNRYSAVDDVLEGRAEEVQRALRGDPRRFPEEAISAETLGDFTADDFAGPTTSTYVEIFDAAGNLVASSTTPDGRLLPAPGPASFDPESGVPEQNQRTYKISGDRIRVLHAPLGANGVLEGTIVVGRSLTGVDRALADLRNVMILGGLGVLLVVGVLGYFLTGRELKPLANVSTTAREISRTGDFSRRIDVNGNATEVDRLAVTFNDMIGTVQQTFDAQREFLADSSHELRRPLTIIRGNIDLLANPQLSEEGRAESLDEMKAEAERMSTLIADLLLLARVERREAVQPAMVEFGALVRDVVQRHRGVEGGPVIACTAESPLPVEGDEGRLRQLVSNLVDNAVEYTRPGGRVDVRASRQNGSVSLEVSDNGIGIADADLPRVFDRFFRTPTAQAHSGHGVGLGLSIVKYVAEAHGGSVRAESVPGEWSRFTVEIPAADPEASPA